MEKERIGTIFQRWNTKIFLKNVVMHFAIYDSAKLRRRTLKSGWLFNWSSIRYSIKADRTNFDDMTERLADEEGLKCLAQHFRSEFRHLNEFAVWEKENLAPLVQELALMAINDPQYDWHFLYRLERQKIICMEQYLSHSRVADKDGRYIGKKWLVLCIRLLDYILDYMKITKEQIRRMNIRNLHTLVNSQTIENFYNESGDQGMKFSSGKDIYIRKMERLYHMIRINYTRLWWE